MTSAWNMIETWFCSDLKYKCIHNTEYKMYLQNEKMTKLFLSIFLTKEGLSKYIKLLCKMKLWDKLQKEEVLCKKGVLTPLSGPLF